MVFVSGFPSGEVIPGLVKASTASRDLLALVGRALHGERWQSGLARSLGVSGRQMRRWVAGDAPVPADLRERLLVAIDDHALDMVREMGRHAELSRELRGVAKAGRVGG